MRSHRVHLGDDVREVDYPLGEVVYLAVRDEPVRGVVTSYRVCPCDLLYGVTWGHTGLEQHHYALELTRERPAFEASGSD